MQPKRNRIETFHTITKEIQAGADTNILNMIDMPEKKLVDLTYIRSIAPGNTAFQHTLINEFLLHTPSIIAEIKKNSKANDWNKMKAAAHKLKGSISYVGTPFLIQSVAEIELYCHQQEHAHLIPALVDQLDNNCQKVYTELATELKKRNV